MATRASPSLPDLMRRHGEFMTTAAANVGAAADDEPCGIQSPHDDLQRGNGLVEPPAIAIGNASAGGRLHRSHHYWHPPGLSLEDRLHCEDRRDGADGSGESQRVMSGHASAPRPCGGDAITSARMMENGRRGVQAVRRGISGVEIAGDACAHQTNGRDEPVAERRHCLDVPRTIRIVVERQTQLTDGRVEAEFEGDVGTVRPEDRAKVIATDNRIRRGRQLDEDPHGLRGQAHAPPLAPQFPRADDQLIRAEHDRDRAAVHHTLLRAAPPGRHPLSRIR